MGYAELLARMAENVTPDIQEGDYEKNGLLYCGKCNTPKQTIIELGDTQIKPYCMCECAIAQKEQEDKRDRITAIKQQIARNRAVGFSEAELQNFTFAADDKANPKVSEIAQKYVQNFKKFRQEGKGLMLYGGTGTGKTFIAACITNALLDRGYKCLMTNFPRVINTISGMYEGKQQYIDDLNNYQLLVIDDLAIERQTEYTAEIVQNVIDSRYLSGKPLIVTTNITYKEFLNPVDIRKQRLYSRLKQMCLPIEVKGEDRREQKLSANFAEMSSLLGL